jgi:hypothetical protein
MQARHRNRRDLTEQWHFMQAGWDELATLEIPLSRWQLVGTRQGSQSSG